VLPPPPEARAPCRLRAWLGSGFDSVPAGVPPSGCGNSHGGFSHSVDSILGYSGDVPGGNNLTVSTSLEVSEDLTKQT
jgi:hypothetical protein